MPNFSHLHVHSNYSMLDGVAKISDYLRICKEDGQTAMALTEHGNMYGAIQFYQEALDAGIKPIFGLEAYIVDDHLVKQSVDGKKEKQNHLILLCKNLQGYQNLIKLVSESWIKGFYYKPRIDKRLLAKYSEGLFCLSACMSGEIQYKIIREDIDGAEKAIVQLKDIFGDRFFLEAQNHGMDEDKILLSVLPKLGNKYNIKLVATNDAHYANREDHIVQDAVIAIRDNTTLNDPNLKKYINNEFYLKTKAEMADLFKENPEWLENAFEIGEQCDVKLTYKKVIFPEFVKGPKEGKAKALRQLCVDGWNRKIKGIITDPEAIKAHSERVKYELSVINDNGFADYFLVVNDFMAYAKKAGVPKGPGRGSVGGSLVSYLLDITTFNPLEYGLYFERFLNPSRISPPDIDMDFSDTKRPMMVEYARAKYGENNCANMITFNCFGAKASIRDAMRVYGYSVEDIVAVAKLVPEIIQGVPEIGLEDAYKVEPLLVKKKEEYPEVFALAEKLEGNPRQSSTHASGYVIADREISDYIPMSIDPKHKEIRLTGIDMYSLETIKLLKMDFLGLETLTIMENALASIKRRHGIDIDIEKIDFKDEKTWDLICRGETIGIFQMESDGFRSLLKKARPRTINELADCNALYRPGAMAFIDEYCNVKHGFNKPEYFHPLMEPILKETNSVLVYQEQVMKMCQVLAGFSLPEADQIRKAIGKKDKDEIEKGKRKFAEGCRKLGLDGVDEELITKITDWMTAMSRYNFNKSHAVAYSINGYIMSYLKANYTIEFMCALLNKKVHKTEDYLTRVNDCKANKVPLIGPGVNWSDENGTIDKVGTQDVVRFGLNAIKGVDSSAVASVVKERVSGGKFKDYYDFLSRCDSFIEKKTVAGFALSGAMDELVTSRKWVIDSYDKQKKFLKKSSSRSQASLFSVEEVIDKSLFTMEKDQEDFTQEERFASEKEMIGFYVSGSPLDKYRAKLVDKDSLTNSYQAFHTNIGSKFSLIGIIRDIRRLRDKNSNEMAFFEIEDDFGLVKCVVFASTFKKISKKLLSTGNAVLLYGSLNRNSIVVDRLEVPQ